MHGIVPLFTTLCLQTDLTLYSSCQIAMVYNVKLQKITYKTVIKTQDNLMEIKLHAINKILVFNVLNIFFSIIFCINFI